MTHLAHHLVADKRRGERIRTQPRQHVHKQPRPTWLTPRRDTLRRNVTLSIPLRGHALNALAVALKGRLFRGSTPVTAKPKSLNVATRRARAPSEWSVASWFTEPASPRTLARHSHLEPTGPSDLGDFHPRFDRNLRTIADRIARRYVFTNLDHPSCWRKRRR